MIECYWTLSDERGSRPTDHQHRQAPPDDLAIEAWKPCQRNTLRGFVRCRFDSGLIVDDIAVHVASDGAIWASPPAKPWIDEHGNVVRDKLTGKVKYLGIIGFTSNNVRRGWSDQIIRALQARYPDALKVPKAA